MIRDSLELSRKNRWLSDRAFSGLTDVFSRVTDKFTYTRRADLARDSLAFIFKAWRKKRQFPVISTCLSERSHAARQDGVPRMAR